MQGLLLATPLPNPLGVEGRATVAFLRGPAPVDEKSDRAYRFIYSLAEHTLAYHFNQPIVKLGVGSVARMAVDVAIQMGLAGIRLPLRRVLTSLNTDQFLLVANEIEVRLRDEQENGRATDAWKAADDDPREVAHLAE